MSEWVVLLLGPFLVIAAIAVVGAVVVLAVRSRRQWSARPRDEITVPPQGEQGEQAADPHHRYL